MTGEFPSVEKTGERSRKEGCPCVKFDELLDGEEVGECRVTDWDHVEDGNDAGVTLTEMKSFFTGLMNAFKDVLGVVAACSWKTTIPWVNFFKQTVLRSYPRELKTMSS